MTRDINCVNFCVVLLLRGHIDVDLALKKYVYFLQFLIDEILFYF